MYKKTTYIQKLVALINSLIRIIFLWWIPFNSSFFCTCLYQNLFIYIGEDIASTQYITINTKKILLYKKQKKKTLQFIYSTCTPIYIKRKLPPCQEKGRRNPFLFLFWYRIFVLYIRRLCTLYMQKGSGSEGKNTKWLNHWLTAEKAV